MKTQYWIHDIIAQRIIFTICQEMGVPVERVLSKSRKREFVVSRQIIMCFMKENTRYSLKHIGKLIAGRDHSTVIHAIETIDNLCDNDKKFKDKVNYLREICEKNISGGDIKHTHTPEQRENLETLKDINNQL